jgi:hypothetical protein
MYNRFLYHTRRGRNAIFRHGEVDLSQLPPHGEAEPIRESDHARLFAPRRDGICAGSTLQIAASTRRKGVGLVRFVIEHGYRFVPVWDPTSVRSVPYPENLRDAREWVE